MSKKTEKTSKLKKGESLKMVEKDHFYGDYEATIVEQWKTCIEAANSVSDKRNAANSIFITVNTALLAVITSALAVNGILMSAVGVFICILWLRLLESYKVLNKVKYSIINEIEEMLPLSPFKAEWFRLHSQKNYSGLTKIEKVLPVVFIVLYGLTALYQVAKFLLPLICQCTAN